LSTEADAGAKVLLRDAERIRREGENLLSDLQMRYPTKDEERRLEQMRQEAGDLIAVTGTLLREEEALWLALEERLGRKPVDGEPVTAEDERRAEKIIAESESS
jgi:hypothetical protein